MPAYNRASILGRRNRHDATEYRVGYRANAGQNRSGAAPHPGFITFLNLTSLSSARLEVNTSRPWFPRPPWERETATYRRLVSEKSTAKYSCTFPPATTAGQHGELMKTPSTRFWSISLAKRIKSVCRRKVSDGAVRRRIARCNGIRLACCNAVSGCRQHTAIFHRSAAGSDSESSKDARLLLASRSIQKPWTSPTTWIVTRKR